MCRAVPIVTAVLVILVVGNQQAALALHDSNLDVNTWLTQSNTTATSIDLNKGPVSPSLAAGEVIPGVAEEEEETATAAEDPSAEPVTPTATDDEQDNEDEITPSDEEADTDEDQEEDEDEDEDEEDTEEDENSEE
jgi:hypothetical protein